jgi:hypothetical protein
MPLCLGLLFNVRPNVHVVKGFKKKFSPGPSRPSSLHPRRPHPPRLPIATCLEPPPLLVVTLSAVIDEGWRFKANSRPPFPKAFCHLQALVHRSKVDSDKTTGSSRASLVTRLNHALDLSFQAQTTWALPYPLQGKGTKPSRGQWLATPSPATRATLHRARPGHSVYLAERRFRISPTFLICSPYIL